MSYIFVVPLTKAARVVRPYFDWSCGLHFEFSPCFFAENGKYINLILIRTTTKIEDRLKSKLRLNNSGSFCQGHTKMYSLTKILRTTEDVAVG